MTEGLTETEVNAGDQRAEEEHEDDEPQHQQALGEEGAVGDPVLWEKAAIRARREPPPATRPGPTPSSLGGTTLWEATVGNRYREPCMLDPGIQTVREK